LVLEWFFNNEGKSMIDHTGLNISDPQKSRRFYESALRVLGYEPMVEVPKEFTDGKLVIGYGVPPKPDFWMVEGKPNDPRIHIAFRADNREQVDAFYKAALAAGGRDNGAPGPRPHYHKDYYGAFVLDPDGHNIEAVCHNPT
jgi:catechol 2,3-dioxygenase-like lactoylglutathione lyase family enzyme